MFFTRIIVRGSYFSLCARRSFRIPPRLPIPPRRLLSHHLNHLIPHHKTSSCSSQHTSSHHFITQTSHYTASHTNYHTAIHNQLLTQQSDHTVTATISSHSTHHSTTHGFRVTDAVHRVFLEELSCGRRRIHSLLEELVGAAGPRLAFVWQLQYTEPSAGAGARVDAARSRLAFVWQTQNSKPSGASTRVGAAGPRLASIWQAEFLEPSGGAGACVEAAGPRLAFMWQAQYTKVFWRSWCARGRRWAAADFCVVDGLSWEKHNTGWLSHHL